MGTRGRKSGEEITSGALTLFETRRPAPPHGLSEAERTVWRDVVGCMAAGWLARSQYPILTAYCRHTVRAEMLAAEIEGFRPEWLVVEGGLARLDKIMAMAERETRAITACARSMRLTHQAQVRPPSAGSAAARQPPDGRRPWDPAD
jgi:hypothetical protein